MNKDLYWVGEQTRQSETVIGIKILKRYKQKFYTDIWTFRVTFLGGIFWKWNGTLW